MQWGDLVRGAVFVTAVGLVYVLAAEIIVKALVRRRRGDAAPAGPLWYRVAILGLAALGLACMAYGRFVEPYWPQVTHVEIKTEKVSRRAPAVRIVQISDVHSDARPRLEERLPLMIAAQKPDLIVFTGDAANQRAGLPVFRKLMRALSGIAPTYAVKGNWDVERWTSAELFADTGVHELDGAATEVSVRGVDLWLAGVPFDEPDRIPTVLAKIPASAFTILLYHSPDMIESLPPDKVDLYLAGHTHGGQIALPFYGPLMTFSKFGRKYARGLHRFGKTWLYVNRGIGMEGGPVPRVRFCARPEITVLDIVGTG